MSDNDLELIEDWLAERNLTRATEYNYRIYLTKFVIWLRENGQEHQTVSLRTVKDWITSHGWGNSTAYQTVTCIRGYSVWRFGETCTLSKLRIKHEDAGEQRTLNQEEVNRLWTYLNKPLQNRRNEEARLRTRAILSILLDTGLRASELCRLDLKRLDLEGRYLSVMGKNNKPRKCVVSETTVGRLREWLVIRETLARPDCSTVFCGLEINIRGENTEAGRPMRRNGLYWVMRRLGEATGVPLTVHALRRTFATMAIRKGASTRLVMLQGGWSRMEMLERYTRALRPDDFRGFFPSEN